MSTKAIENSSEETLAEANANDPQISPDLIDSNTSDSEKGSPYLRKFKVEKEEKNSDAEYFFNSSRLIFLGLIFTLIVFNSFFLEKFNKLIVKDGISTVHSNWLLDLVIGGGTTYFLLWIYHESKSRKGRFNTLTILLSAFCLLHFYFRTDGSMYVYQKFVSFQGISCFAGIAYLDVCFLIVLLLLLIKIEDNISDEKPIYFNDPFAIDVPIGREEDDRLNRSGFAEQIAHKIQSSPIQKKCGSLAIGITGEWGSGKTSFCHMIEERIDPKGRIILKFNPWRSNSPEKIVSDFFEVLIAELRVYDRELAQNIYDYAQEFTNIDHFAAKAVKLVSTPFTSKSEYYERVNNSIEAIDKQIIIFIDDLDRLSKAEIVEVLRIIRNTANFNNTVYIVCYDKEYVVDALKYYNESKYRNYLEKIFQIEFNLPSFDSKIVRNYLLDLMIQKFGQNCKDELYNIINNSVSGVIFTEQIIKTHRDAIRLFNAYSFEIHGIHSEVNWYDFYLLQLIKLKFPQVYAFIVTNPYLVFISDRNNNGYLRLRRFSDRINTIFDILGGKGKTSENDSNKDNPTNLCIYLKQENIKKHISDQDLLLIESIVDELLLVGREFNKQYSNQRKKFFAVQNNFLRYFAFGIPEGEIPYLVFEDFRKRPFDEYATQINEWIQENKFQSLWDFLIKLNHFDTVLEFENHVKALKNIGNTLYKNGQSQRFDLSFFVLTLLSIYDKNRSEVQLYPTLETYHEFLRSIIKTDEIPAIFESDLVRFIIEKEYIFPIEMDELSVISIGYLEDYIDARLPLDDNLWEIFRNSKMRDNSHFMNKIHPKANDVVKSYWKKNVSACGLSILVRHSSPDSSTFYLDLMYYAKLFNNFQEIVDWFNNTEHLDQGSGCYQEFKVFLEAVQAANFGPVEFHFDHLKPNLIR
jgi:Predicted P-loop ATPase